MKSVFVSASVPDPRRDPRYFRTADVVAIRDAITALVQVVTAQDRLVFGGHPAITPMVARVAAAQGTLHHVAIYQSQWFQPFFPQENAAFQSLVLTKAASSLAESLQIMRTEMLHSEPFAAAFFIGGMEGVEQEFADLRRLPNPPPCFPIATTGGAALLLAEEHRRSLQEQGLMDVFTSYDYYVFFRRLLRSLRGNS